MAKASQAALRRFAKLAEGEEGKVAFRAGFGTGAMFVGQKMFAVLDASGALVVKLPAERVQELIASGVGAPWHPGTGRPLKEYVAVGVAHQGKWLGLAKDARTYMSSKR